MQKENKKIKTEGSVLYTVVAVMMVMSVFIFAALSLASAANKRAFNSYANNQTQFTARSIIDTLWSKVSGSSEILSKITKLPENGQLDIEVDGIEKSLGMGEIVPDNSGKRKVTVTCIGDKLYKMSVTVSMLGQENTISAYYSASVTDTRPSFKYGLVTLKGGSVDNVISYGGSCIGIEPNDTGSSLSNNCIINSPLYVNGDFNIVKAENITMNQGNGMVVFGDINFHNIDYVKAELNDKLLDYRKLPYIHAYQSYYWPYSGGAITYNSGSVTIGSENTPVLVISGSISQNQAAMDNPIYGDLYLLGRHDESIINRSGIKPWKGTDILKKKIAGTGASYTGGNIYSLGAVNYYVVDGSAEAPRVIANNIVADKFSLMKHTDSKYIKTTGAVVAKNINISNICNSTFANGMFTDPNNFTCENGAVINKNVFVNNNMYDTASTSAFISSAPNTPAEGQANPNIYWNTDTSETHDYTFKMSDFIPNYDPANWDYILKSVKINIDGISNYWNFDMKAEIKDSEGSPYASYQSVWVHDGIAEVYFKESDIHLRSDNTISFKLDKIYQAWHLPPQTVIKTNGITIEAEVRSKYRNVYKITEYIKGVNDEAFANNGNVIQIDDIDKAVRLTKYGDSYSIQVADLTGIEEGQEGTAVFTDVGTYTGADYYEFLLQAVNTITFPESIGVHTFMDEVVEYNDADDYIATITDKNKNPIKRTSYKYVTDQQFADNGYTRFQWHLNESGERVYDYRTVTPADLGLSEFYSYNNQTGEFKQIYSFQEKIPVYQTDEYGNPVVNEQFNGLKSQSMFGYNGFVNDTFLYGDNVNSGMRDSAKNETRFIFEHYKDATDNMVYEFARGNGEVFTNPDGSTVSVESNGYVKITGNGQTLYQSLKDEPLKLDSSCTFKGNIYGKIEIAPAVDNIYIKLDNINLEDGSNIVIDDTKGRVNFLIPAGQTLNINGNILTKYYSEHSDIPNNPVIRKKTGEVIVDEEKIPDVYFYMEYDETKKGTININNGHRITGYVLAPTGTLNCNASGKGDPMRYYHDKVPVTEQADGTQKFSENGKDITVQGGILIGAVICEKAGLNNCVFVGFVNPNPTDEYGNKISNFIPKLQYYQAQ